MAGGIWHCEGWKTISSNRACGDLAGVLVNQKHAKRNRTNGDIQWIAWAVSLWNPRIFCRGGSFAQATTTKKYTGSYHHRNQNQSPRITAEASHKRTGRVAYDVFDHLSFISYQYFYCLASLILSVLFYSDLSTNHSLVSGLAFTSINSLALRFWPRTMGGCMELWRPWWSAWMASRGPWHLWGPGLPAKNGRNGAGPFSALAPVTVGFCDGHSPAFEMVAGDWSECFCGQVVNITSGI